MSSGEPDSLDEAADSFTVVFKTRLGETRLRVHPDEYILSAARRADVLLPSLCEQGWCTTCAARILEGEVDQSDSLRFYPEDRQAGFALLCTGRARSNLVLRTHAAAELREHRRALRLPTPHAAGV